MTKESEEWRPVVGYEGWYAISNLGRVRRERAAQGASVGHILKALPNRSTGRMQVALLRGGIKTQRRINVHTLVAAAFLGQRPVSNEINHIDGNKTNNRADNLEYRTMIENRHHAAQMRIHAHGESHGFAKLLEADVRAILVSVDRDDVLARRYGVTRVAISAIRCGRNWKHMGLKARPNRGRGELRSDSRLTDEIVKAVRASRASTAALARQYGVSWGTVDKARRGETWAHVC